MKPFYVVMILSIIVCFSCDDATNIELNDIGLDELSKVVTVPVFSYEMGVEDIFNPEDFGFNVTDGDQVVTLVYSTDTTVRFVNDSVRIVDPEVELINVDFNVALDTFSGVSFARRELFDASLFPGFLDFGSSSTPDEITLPDSVNLPGVILEDIDLNLPDPLLSFELITGQLRFNIANLFQCEVQLTYELINGNQVLLERTLSLEALASLPFDHVITVDSPLVLDENDTFFRVKDVSFSNGILGQGNIVIDMSILPNWKAGLIFSRDTTFSMGKAASFPLVLNSDGNDTRIYELGLGISTALYASSSTPFETRNRLNFILENSELSGEAFELPSLANATFQSRRDLTGTVLGDQIVLEHLDSLRYFLDLIVPVGERVVFDNAKPELNGVLSFFNLSNELQSFAGDIKDSFQFDTLREELFVTLFRNTFLISDELQLPEMSLDLNFSNAYDIDFTLDLASLDLQNDEGILIRSISASSGLPQLKINRLVPDDEGEIPLENLVQLIDSKPRSIAFLLRPQIEFDDEVERFDFDDSLQIDIDFTVPMQVDGSGLIFRDTVQNPFIWSDEITELFLDSEPLFRFAYKNQFPIDFTGQIYLLGLNKEVIDTVFDTEVELIASSIESTEFRDEIIQNELLQNIINSTDWIFDLTYSSQAIEVDSLNILHSDHLFVECLLLREEI